MLKLIDQKGIEEIIGYVNDVQPQLNETKKELGDYVTFLKQGNYDLSENGTIDEQIKRYETVLDKYDEISSRRKEISEKGKVMKEMIETMQKKVNEMLSVTGDKDQMDEIHDEMVYKLMELEDEKCNRRKAELEKLLRNKVRKEDIERLKGIVDENEIKQLQEWSSMKCGEVVFDSDKDNWNPNTSVFDDKVMNRSNLIFVVEDTSNNKFGLYTTTKVEKYDSYHTDQNAFLFSLKSNGRLNDMQKYNISFKKYGFYLCHKSNENIFWIGNGSDICIKKKGNPGSYCNQRGFNYQGISNALCGGSKFTPKRITVIQMK